MSNQGAEHRFEDTHKQMSKTSDSSSHLQHHAYQLLKEHSIANGPKTNKGHEPQSLEFNPIAGFDPEKAMQSTANFIKHTAGEIAKGAEYLGKEWDKTPAGKKIDEITDHNPAEKAALGIAAGGIIAAGALVGVSEIAAIPPAVAGVLMARTYVGLHDEAHGKGF